MEQIKQLVMGNYRNELSVNVINIRPFKMEMFVELFSIDDDYSINEEYFREDTLSLGYKNESERVSEELSNKFTKVWDKIKDKSDEEFGELIEEYLELACKHSLDETSFILGNSTHTYDYKLTILSDFEDWDEEIQVVISYIN